MRQSAGVYHHKTRYRRSRMGGHFLDWQNQPDVFKRYEGLRTVKMPRDMPFPHEDLFSLYESPRHNRLAHEIPDLEKLSGILLLTYTLTSQTRHSGGLFYYRSAASAGALYPTEIYVMSHGVGGLDHGIYHFSIADHSLVELRRGSFLDAASPSIRGDVSGDTPLTFFLTAIFARSAWKYRDRSYRYHLLDTGHVLENLHLSLKAFGCPFENTFDFEDHAVNGLLGLDEDREVALAIARVKGNPDPPRTRGSPAIEDLPEAVKRASIVTPREVDVREVRMAHNAGYDILYGKADLNMCHGLGIMPKTRVSVPAVSMPEAELPYPEAVFRRRSSRNFVPGTLPVSHLHALLKVVSATDYAGTDRRDRSICTGLLTNGVESLEDGFYGVDEMKGRLSLVKSGSITGAMSRICLDQEWMGSAPLHFVFMTNMALLEAAWGPRGYRYAMLTSGLVGERLYVAASALGLGCCGVGAFYDGEASRLLGLNESSRVLYVVALGILKSMLKRDPML